MIAKILRVIMLLESMGAQLNEPFSKYLGQGIFELRVKSRTNITRILYFFVIGDKAVLANAFVKKTNKTPRKEIDLALKRKNDYLKRCL